MFESEGFDAWVRAVVTGLVAVDPDGLPDAGLIGLIRDTERVMSWAAAVQATGVAALAGRRLDPLPDGHPSGISAPVAGQGGVNEFCVDELAVALHATTTRAAGLLGFAVDLARLPATRAALRDGRIDVPRARVLTTATQALSDQAAHAVEQAVLPGAPGWTSGQLRAAVTRAVAQVDPDGLTHRNRAERAARAVTVSGDPTSGTASLTTRGLDAVDARTVWESLDAIAHALDGTGDPRGLDARRADAVVALLTGRDPLPDWTTPPDTSTAHPTRQPGVHPAGPAGPAGPGDSGGLWDPHIGGLPPGVTPVDCTRPGRVDPRRHVTLQVVADTTTLAGITGEPAWVPGYGWVTPTHARALLTHADLTTSLAVVDPHTGTLLTVSPPRAVNPHDLNPTPDPDDPDPDPDDPDPDPDPDDPDPGDPDGPGDPGGGSHPPGRPSGPSGPHRPSRPGRPGGRAGQSRPPAGPGPTPGDTPAPTPGATPTTTPTPATPAGTAPVYGYRPPPTSDRLIRARDLVCRFPGCRHPATHTDLDHLIAYPAGPTTPHNLWALCRRHHRLKHTSHWQVHALTDAGTTGPTTWTTPTGHTRTTTPPHYTRRQ